MSSWGDPYYLGLNGIELYDEKGGKIQLKDNSELTSLFRSGVQFPKSWSSLKISCHNA